MKTYKILAFPFYFFLCSTFSLNCQNLNILPLGNSITKGVNCTNGFIDGCTTLPDSQITGYRNTLFNLLYSSGYSFDFVGSEVAGWSVFTEYTHAGYPGINSAGLAVKLNENNNYLLNSNQPDIILLEIGTNDVVAGITNVSSVQTILNEINEYETAWGKPVIVFLAKIPQFLPGSYNANLVSTFNTNLYNLYNTRKSSGDLIEWVDVAADFINTRAGDMMDELHPKQSGYDKMGQRWFQAIDGYNKAPVASSIPGQNTNEGNAFPQIPLDAYISDVEDNDANITWTIPTPPQNLNVSIDGSRMATITPKNNEWYGTENVTFCATDRGKVLSGLRKSVYITVTFTVSAVNDPPVILSQTRIPSTMEETPVVISLTDLQVQDIDNPQTDLSLLVLAGANYSVVGNTVTPSPDFNGELAVGIKASDNQSSGPLFSFRLNVSPSNDKPVIVSGNEISMNEDASREMLKTDFQVLDPDNTWSQDFTLFVQNGTNYTRSGNTITPAKDFNGQLGIKVIMRDQLDNSDVYEHFITVLPVNDPPLINIPSNRNAVEGDFFEITLTPADADVTDSPFLTAIDLPEWMSFSSVDGKLSGTPGSEDVGSHLVKMRVDDLSVEVDSLFTVEVDTKTATDETGSSDFKIYPNPASDYIHIETDLSISGELEFRLINTSGMTLMQKTLQGTHSIINIPATVTPGLYIYQVRSGKIFRQGKINVEPRIQ